MHNLFKIDQEQSTGINAFVLGLTSITGQILLLRELIGIFYGNEMAYAVILAGWLLWVAFGSYLISLFASRIKRPISAISFCQLSVFFLLPASIIAARHINLIMSVKAGEIIGMIPMCISSFLLLAPLALIQGGLFTLTCRFSEQISGERGRSSAVGKIYFWESVGAAAGGAGFSFLLVRILPAMHIAFLIGAINLIVGVLVFKRKDILFWAKIILLFVVMGFLWKGALGRLDQWTRNRQWKGFDVITVEDSIYGSITLVRTGKEYNLYQNGLFSYATEDDLSSEESVHFAMLSHPDPKNVLLLGNGMGGSLQEILKHSVAQVDYVELDPKVIEVSEEFLPEEYLKPLSDERVSVFHADARWLIKQKKNLYDVVIVNLSDPFTALINRYYSLEFFREVTEVLNPSGVFSLSVSSSENYLNAETRTFLRSVNSTLKQVFPDVKSIPGDKNIFLASNDREVLTYDYQVFVNRLKERLIDAKYVREYYLPDKMSPDRIRYIESVLKEKGAINTDMHPVTYLYDIVLWSTHFNTAFKKLINRIRKVKAHYLLVLPLMIFIGGATARRFSSSAPVTLSIATTGFSEIIFQLVVILAFQTLYGYAYYKIGLIMASFMAGLCIGAHAAGRIIARVPEEILHIYKKTQFAIFVYPLLLPVLFVVFRDVKVMQDHIGIFATLFAVLPVIAGVIGGMQYPLATYLFRSLRTEQKGVAGPAGFLYAMDVFGAGIGALLTGAILIPVYGIFTVALLCAAINGAAFLLLYPVKWSPDV